MAAGPKVVGSQSDDRAGRGARDVFFKDALGIRPNWHRAKGSPVAMSHMMSRCQG